MQQEFLEDGEPIPEGTTTCSCGVHWFWDWDQDEFRNRDGDKPDSTKFTTPKGEVDVTTHRCTDCGMVFAVDVLDEHGHFVFDA